MRPDEESRLSDAMRWAIDASMDASQASADWLARDIAPHHGSAVDLLTDREIPLRLLRQAKSAFKTMRIVGETSADRRLGARMYAATIAAGLVWHGRRISSQSDAALRRAFAKLLDDRDVPDALRTLAGKALNYMDNPSAHPKADQLILEDVDDED